MPISSLVPTVNVLLALEPAEVGAVRSEPFHEQRGKVRTRFQNVVVGKRESARICRHVLTINVVPELLFFRGITVNTR